jgi:hypothetical protein
MVVTNQISLVYPVAGAATERVIIFFTAKGKRESGGVLHTMNRQTAFILEAYILTTIFAPRTKSI